MTYSLQYEVFLASCYWAISYSDKLLTQQMKSWLLNAARVLLVQQQIFINKIHLWQVESYSYHYSTI